MPHVLMTIARTFTPKFDLLVSSAFALFFYFFKDFSFSFFLIWECIWTSRHTWGFPPFVLFLCSKCYVFHFTLLCPFCIFPAKIRLSWISATILSLILVSERSVLENHSSAALMPLEINIGS